MCPPAVRALCQRTQRSLLCSPTGANRVGAKANLSPQAALQVVVDAAQKHLLQLVAMATAQDRGWVQYGRSLCIPAEGEKEEEQNLEGPRLARHEATRNRTSSKIAPADYSSATPLAIIRLLDAGSSSGDSTTHHQAKGAARRYPPATRSELVLPKPMHGPAALEPASCWLASCLSPVTTTKSSHRPPLCVARGPPPFAAPSQLIPSPSCYTCYSYPAVHLPTGPRCFSLLASHFLPNSALETSTKGGTAKH